MPYPRKQTLSAASLAANRRNARKSTGPRNPKDKARAALHAIKHGLSAPCYSKNLAASGESTAPYWRIAKRLLAVLRPSSRLTTKRMVRYSQMLWSLQRRAQIPTPRNAPSRTRIPMTKAELVLQRLVLKDLLRAQERGSPEQRQTDRKLVRLIGWLGWQAVSGLAALKNANQSRNVVENE